MLITCIYICVHYQNLNRIINFYVFVCNFSFFCSLFSYISYRVCACIPANLIHIILRLYIIIKACISNDNRVGLIVVYTYYKYKMRAIFVEFLSLFYLYRIVDTTISSNLSHLHFHNEKYYAGRISILLK